MLVHTLKLNPDHEVQSFMTGEDLLKALSDPPDLITLDYRLPDYLGNELLSKIKETKANINVIVISEQGDIETAVELLKLGAYDYLVKTNDIRERLLHSVNHATENLKLKTQVKELRFAIRQKHGLKETMIGESDTMKSVFALVEKASGVDITVSIYGETGTGKEVVAKAIHYGSERAGKNFVAVNLTAVPVDLIESELFGHEKGAFTGAIHARKGKFEETDGGTLFLDEIGEVDLNFQKKLLRVLQEREVVRVGSNRPIQFDCRILVATNKDLMALVKNGQFREDLYYRLKGLPVNLPPLRERGDDIELLTDFFLAEFCKRNKVGLKSLSETALTKLKNYNWPGNIRELKSVVELAVVLASSDTVEAEDVHLGSTQDVLPNLLTSKMTLREYDIRIVMHFMAKHNGDTKKVAQDLGIGQTTVYRLLKEAKSS
jgi:DNA-binding NtrC family response regulator